LYLQYLILCIVWGKYGSFYRTEQGRDTGCYRNVASWETCLEMRLRRPGPSPRGYRLQEINGMLYALQGAIFVIGKIKILYVLVITEHLKSPISEPHSVFLTYTFLGQHCA
jgi:hypothetical protein